jgi:DNA-binding CsgD family transcriptional regulator
LAQGRLAEAGRVADRVLGEQHVSPVSQIPALLVAGTVAVRRADDRAGLLLDRARALADGTGEAQRIVPTALARAEAAWTRGDDPTGVGRELEPTATVEAEHIDSWKRGELTWWHRVAGREDSDVDVPLPVRLMLDGDPRGAADAWEAHGCRWWQAVCLGLSPDLDDARAGVEMLTEIGAEGTRQAVLRDRHTQGLAVPRGPRRTTRDNPAGLTPRELEVLALLAEGLTNAQLAGRLFLSEKTVDHHVSAVLRKLGEPTRARAVAAAHGKGLLPNMGSSPDVAT